jgi:NitT/TauT family transport system ATP-binding protein
VVAKTATSRSDGNENGKDAGLSTSVTSTPAPRLDPAPTPVRGIGLSVLGLSKVFPGNVRAIDPIDLRIDAGDFVALIGPSGCGKSTLLRIIAGLDSPTAGVVTRTASTSSDKTHRDVAYVFQDAHLLPWRRVLANVSLPLELSGIGRAEREQRAMDALRQVGLADLYRRYPMQLSGGQRMRVSMARALVTSPDLLLLDEPFAALDEITRQQLDEMLRSLWRSRGMTVLFVTHSIAEATFLANRAIVFTPRPARVSLDHDLRIVLPDDRLAELRGTATFAEQTRVLYRALEAS